MMHDIAIRCGNGARSAELGLPKIDHRKNHCLWFGEEISICTKTGASRVVGSRVRGTCTPLGTGWAYRVCSHVCGTYRRLLSRAGRATNIGERLQMSRHLGRRNWLFKSGRWQRYHM